MSIEGTDGFDDIYGIAILMLFAAAWLNMVRFGRNGQESK